jgi:hypothetical protein
MLNIPEGSTITVTNTSSRAFVHGGTTFVQKVPTVVDADVAKAISNSKYAEYFKFSFSTDNTPTQEEGTTA